MANKGTAPHNKGRKSTHCKCGLPRTPENTNASGYCKVCSNAAQARWRELHPHAERGKHYPYRYGVTKEQFDAQCELQGNRCAVCFVEFDYSHRETTPNLDHKHDVTQKFRGVLCHCCNTGLGLFGDSIAKLRNAIQYLEKTQ